MSNHFDDAQARGPLVDDGAPYSAIGQVELMLLRNHLGMNDKVQLEPIPDALNGYTHWQYGVGKHSSDARPILGSVEVNARTDSGREVMIRHLVLDGSSQWVIGKNVTRRSDILHAERNAVRFIVDGVAEYFSLYEKDLLSYMPISAFEMQTCNDSVLVCLNGNLNHDRPWKEVKAIIDKVHRHVCGHASLTDMRLLLERNNLWSDRVVDYVHKLIENCVSCRSTAPPQPNRKVSISSLSNNFNEVVCVDHFYLDGVQLLHCMDTATRCSAAFVVSSTALDDAVFGFENCWVNQFWLPESIHGDKAFAVGKFKQYMDERSISFRLVPPNLHSKNPLESKHGVIRSIFLKLRNAEPDVSPELHACRAVAISNDLYGNDVMSSYELAKGYTKPVSEGGVKSIPQEIVDAHEKLQAKRKLA